jgi:hypothetical protein
MAGRDVVSSASDTAIRMAKKLCADKYLRVGEQRKVGRLAIITISFFSQNKQEQLLVLEQLKNNRVQHHFTLLR